MASVFTCMSLLLLVVCCRATEMKNVYSKTDSSPQLPSESKEAYVTLLFGDFLLGVRVLGQSLRDSGTQKDMLVLCADDVSEKSKEILAQDGWTVKLLSDIPNPHPNKGGPNFITKLLTWQLTEYRRLVYIDADAVVVTNVDDLFHCGSFCVTYRHSDLFNAGIEVLKPSTKTFLELHAFVRNLPTEFQDDDQVLLNVFYKNLRYAPMFNSSDNTQQEAPMRLPAGYNSDIGMYYVNSGWKMPPESVYIIHYTLGPLKPWKWWAYTLFDLNWRWNDLRGKLACETEPKVWTLRNWFPPIMTVVLWIVIHCCSKRFPHLLDKVGKPTNSYITNNRIVRKMFPLAVTLVTFYLAYHCVPMTMKPHHAIFSFCIWVVFLNFVLYALYCSVSCPTVQSNGARVVRKTNVLVSARFETILWVLYFAVSILLLYYIPFFVSPFSFRVRVFICVCVLFVVSCHFVGRRVISLWIINHDLYSQKASITA